MRTNIWSWRNCKIQEVVNEAVKNPSNNTGEKIVAEEVVVEEPQIIEEVLSTTTEPSNDIFDFTTEYETKVDNINNSDLEARLNDLI